MLGPMDVIIVVDVDPRDVIVVGVGSTTVYLWISLSC